MFSKHKQYIAIAILSVFCVGLIISITVVVALDAQDSFVAPQKDVAVVLLDRGRGRIAFQIAACTTFMIDTEFSRLIVVTTDTTAQFAEEVSTIRVTDVSSLETLFMQLGNRVPDLDHFVFLSDTSVPVRPILLRDLYTAKGDRRLLFNHLLLDSILMPQLDILEPTMPTIIEDAQFLKTFSTLQAYILYVANDNKVVFSGNINQLLMLIDNDVADNLTLLIEPKPHELFQTVIIPIATVGDRLERLLAKISILWS